MTELITLLHSYFKNRRAEAAYLGYSARGYYNIRQLIERGEALHRRVEDHLRLKASVLVSQKNKESHCDCPYKSHRKKIGPGPVQGRPGEVNGPQKPDSISSSVSP